MGDFRKSIYIFLCSLMGVLLFLVLHRVIMLSYLLLVAAGVFHWRSPDSYLVFVAVDYITLLLVMICGSWYGIWIGSYWYEQVYELGMWRGAMSHLRRKFFNSEPVRQDFRAKIEEVKQNLVEDLAQVQVLAKQIPQEILHPAPIKRSLPAGKAGAPRKKAAAPRLASRRAAKPKTS